MGVGQTFKLYQYFSDDTKVYQVKLSEDDAGSGGFGLASGTEPIWPFHNKHMRHVWGRTSDGKRTRLPCADQSNTLFTTGGSFTLQGRPYTVYGQIGEFRDARNF